MSNPKKTAVDTIGSVVKYINVSATKEEIAVTSIMHDLCDRRGIKDAFHGVSKDTLKDMQMVWVEIIKECIKN